MVVTLDFQWRLTHSLTLMRSQPIPRRIIPGMASGRYISTAFCCGSLSSQSIFTFLRLLVGAPKGNRLMLKSEKIYNPGVVMRCDFKNDIGCSALPFQSPGEEKMIYLPTGVFSLLFSSGKKQLQNSILASLRILCSRGPKSSPVYTDKVLNICMRLCFARSL